MTYNVLMGTLNPTRSFIRSCQLVCNGGDLAEIASVLQKSPTFEVLDVKRRH